MPIIKDNEKESWRKLYRVNVHNQLSLETNFLSLDFFIPYHLWQYWCRIKKEHLNKHSNDTWLYLSHGFCNRWDVYSCKHGFRIHTNIHPLSHLHSHRHLLNVLNFNGNHIFEESFMKSFDARFWWKNPQILTLTIYLEMRFTSMHGNNSSWR